MFAIFFALALVVVGVVTALAGKYMRLAGRSDVGAWRVEFVGHVLCSVGCWISFGCSLALGEWYASVFGGSQALYWTWAAWRLWKKRPPRDRRVQRMLGRVRDLGHRLVVAPEPFGAGT